MAGVPLYSAYGFVPVVPVEHVEDTSTGTPIPLLRMAKAIDDLRAPIRSGREVAAGAAGRA